MIRGVLWGVVAAAWMGCTRPECQPPDYGDPECRELAAHDGARVITADGVEVRFQDPRTRGTRGWAASGLLRVGADGVLEGRVGTLGALRLSVHRRTSTASRLDLRLTNVHPRVRALPFEVGREGLVRTLEVELDADVVDIVGTLEVEVCEGDVRLAVVGDIQTNPGQFERVLQALHDEAALGPTLLGLVFVGDAAENGTAPELDQVADLLDTAPVPTALTPGNHDITDRSAPVFSQAFGPGTMAFDVCDTHVVLLDTGSGALAESVVGRLPELLRTEQPRTIAGMHYPLYPALSANGWTREDQAQLTVAELAEHDVDLVVAGHVHARRVHDVLPMPQVIVGTGGASQGAARPDYGFLRVDLAPKLPRCFVPVPEPGAQPTDGEPANCGAR